MSRFCNLHVHSEGSFLDGYSKVEQIARRAKELGQSAVAITDHGEVNQHLAFQKACQAEQIRPVFGMEGYWAPDIPAIREFCAGENKGKWSSQMSHLCLLAKSNEGLRNLWALSSIAYDDYHFFHRPLADAALLREYGKDLYASDGCIMTTLGRVIRRGDEDAARQYLGSLQAIFGERFYVELHTWQYMHPSDEEWVEWESQPMTTVAVNKLMTDLNQAKIRWATEMGIPMVVVNDAHHAYPEHWQYKEMVWGFKKETNPDQQEGKGQKADHMMADEELIHWMGNHGVSQALVEQAIAYSGQIADSCEVEIKPMLEMPKFTQSEADDFQMFMDKVEAGFKAKVEINGLPREAYWKRLETEVSMISSKRFAGYFLVVEDYVRAARTGTWAHYVQPSVIAEATRYARTKVQPGEKVPMMIGPGRGSAGGSLVAWLMGITNIDPIKYGLLFERFLAPGRKGYPDIDIDFPRSMRKGVREYLKQRWGEDRVCSICTMSRNQAKASVRDLARALDIEDYSDINAIAKLVDEISTEDWDDAESSDEDNETWSDLVEKNYKALAPWITKYPELFDKLRYLHGIVRTTNVHAAAALISDTPFAGVIPTRVKNDTLMTQFDMYGVEDLGGLKADLLALRHLDALMIARDLIKERHGRDIDPDAFTDDEYNDPAIWTQIDEGQTVGIFQLGTPGGTDAAIEFRPRSMVDVADLISINRPGVRDAGLYHVYLRRRAGLEPVAYDHPLMETIAKDTFGVLVYQEQLMQTSRELAGFTPDEADDLRKAVGKKIMEKVLALKDKFVAGCLANPDYMAYFGEGPTTPEAPNAKDGIATIERIWASIEASGRYCVVGDTRVKLSNGDEMSVADMYRRLTDDHRLEGRPCWYGCRFTGYRGKCQTCRVWRQKFRDSRGLKAWSLGDDGRLHPNRILEVYQNGVQPVWRVTLENGDSITATADHRHMTSAGWREVRELSVGDELLVNGRRVRGEKGYPTIPTRVVSIECAGEETVYDLSMAIPHHSWVGNNIVTHNCFNKSHAIGYALISHAEIWFKHYFPAEMLVGFMMVDEVRRNKFIRDARRRKIGILPPDVNLSLQNFTIDGNNIRYGVQAVFGLGDAAANELVAGQPYTSLEDYLKRAKRGANKTSAVALAKIGALDCFGSREAVLQEIQHYRLHEKLAASTMANPTKLAKIIAERMAKPDYQIEIPNFADDKVLYAIEQELVGSFVTIDPMGRYLSAIDAECVANPAVLRRYQPGQRMAIGGEITKVRETTVKKGRQQGQKMCFIAVDWQGDEYDIVAFPGVYSSQKLLLRPGVPVICVCEKTDRGVSLIKVHRLDLIWEEDSHG